ncbi:cysteine-rich receptor-like protein kinase 10 [Wolffia australiana]
MSSLDQRPGHHDRGQTPHFQANLDRLISSLIASTPSTGFVNNTIGDAPDVIYGLAVCRGDLGFDYCQKCLSNATYDAKSSCPRNKAGTLFYELCQLRYSDVNFYGTSTYTQRWMTNGNNGTTGAISTFNGVLGGLLNNLTAQAATSIRRYAADRVVLNDFQRVYVLVQCTRDLSPKACSDCLTDEIGHIPTCCDVRRGASIGSLDLNVFKDPCPMSEAHPPTKSLQLTAAASSHALVITPFGTLMDGHLGGTLKDGQIIAVKRLVNNDGEGLDELRNEVALVAKLQHRNLVRLLGYCLQAQEKILIYEYLPNKSLDKFIFDPSKSKFLTWANRMRITEGIGRGLLNLHEDSRFKVIHRDLKANNILVDENLTAKIADFGLAKLFGNEQSYENTQRISGTYGYMAPEYVMHGHISTKSDVYSFDILLLEILTRKRCVGFHGSSPPTDFLSYVCMNESYLLLLFLNFLT